MNILLGGGTIGPTVAYMLAVQCPSVNLTLVDPRTAVTEDYAIDLRHSYSDN